MWEKYDEVRVQTSDLEESWRATILLKLKIAVNEKV